MYSIYDFEKTKVIKILFHSRIKFNSIQFKENKLHFTIYMHWDFDNNFIL